MDWLKTPVEPVTSETALAPADEFDWLEGVGEPEPASATPAMEQPDWLTQFGSEPPVPAVEEAPAPAKSEINPPTGPHDRPTAPPFPALDVASLGKTDRERDDSFAWLEALAAKQGASEGLLTKPEDRLQEEPEWIKQAKGTVAPEAAEPATIQQPPEVIEPPVIPATVEEPGKSEQERDDSFAWLEALAANQGAS